MNGKKMDYIIGVGNKAELYQDLDAVQIQFIVNELQAVIQQRHSETALRESEKQYRLLTRRAPMPIAICDQGGAVLYINDQFTRTFGYTNRDIPNLRGRRPRSISKRYGRKPDSSIWKKIKGWATDSGTFIEPGDCLVPCKSGSFCTTEILITKIKNQILVVFNDITEREAARQALVRRRNTLEKRVASHTAEADAKNIRLAAEIVAKNRLEKELIKARKIAEEANHAKSAFLANMSHEIRTPMNSILGFSQLLLQEPGLNVPQKNYLNTINRNGEHLLKVINDILEISKIEAGQDLLHIHSFDLHALLEDIESMFRLQAEAKGLQILVERTRAVPRSVIGDESKLQQVFINLIGNAIKFTEQGRITLRVHCRRINPKKWKLFFDVEDTGIGIPSAEANKLFQRFQQTRAGKGFRGSSGLGLAISYEFVKMMDGNLSVHSHKGRGTVFSFNIALEQGPDESITRRDRRRVIGLQPGQSYFRILIIDDQEDTRELLLQLLAPLGFFVRHAVNGQEAVTEFNTWQPQLILMDLRMPVLDGHAAIRTIRKSKKGRDVKILALTASVFEDSRKETITDGADDFLGKPFQVSDLLEKISELLGVQYMYADEMAEARPLPEVLPVITPGAFKALPNALLYQLRDAAINGDFERIAELAAQVEPLDAQIAQGLRILATRFDAPRLLDLLQEGGMQ